MQHYSNCMCRGNTHENSTLVSNIFQIFVKMYVMLSDPENIEASDLQRKLEMLNNIMDQEARLEQARRQMQYFGHCKYLN